MVQKSFTRFGKAFFDGNGDYLSVPYSTDISLNGDSFTVEGWVYPTNMSTDRRLFSTGGGVVGFNLTTGIHLLIQTIATTYKLSVNLKDTTASGNIQFTTTAALTLNAWNHVSVSVNNTSKIIYASISGVVESYSFPTQTAGIPSTNPTFEIGNIPGEVVNSNFDYTGNMKGVRITKGRARYTANFTPDEYFQIDGADVKLCMNFAEAIGATTFIDETGKTVTTFGNTIIVA